MVTSYAQGQREISEERNSPAREAVLSVFSGGEAELLAPETKARKAAIHLVAVVALIVSGAYIFWRAGFTLGGNLWISIPLWLLEFHALLSLGLFTFSLWDVDGTEIPAPVTQTDLRIAVLITTFNEAHEILLPTVAAAVALQPSHDTWVLDDGDRLWVRDLATSLGARYMARAEHGHAKAGNLNHALDYLDVDLVAVLDADHVVMPEFLTHTLGYFADPKIAVVQTPQDFYNLDSFEHDRNRSWFWRDRRRTSFNEQRLFYRALQPGKNRWGAAFWCGTNAVVRLSALREVGGVAFETVTEDIHTSLRMHRKGWQTVYHNEVLAHGLAARDANQYQSQRLRWGTGAMQLLHSEHPLSGRGLTLGQRIAYGATILGWFEAWRTLGYVLIPLAVVFTGANPIHAPAVVFLVVFGSTFLLQRLALALLSRGYAPLGMATLFEFVRMQTTIKATLAYLRPGERPFQVTAKDGTDERQRNGAPWLLWFLLGLSTVAALWFVGTLAGLTGVTYPVHWTAYGAAFWIAVNTVLLVAAIVRIRSDRFASDRRTAVRHRIEGDVLIDGRAAQLIDVSVGGALVRVHTEVAHQSAHEMQVSFLDDERIALNCLERSRHAVGDQGVLLSMQFCDGQDPQVARLAVGLFGGLPLSGHKF